MGLSVMSPRSWPGQKSRVRCLPTLPPRCPWKLLFCLEVLQMALSPWERWALVLHSIGRGSQTSVLEAPRKELGVTWGPSTHICIWGCMVSQNNTCTFGSCDTISFFPFFLLLSPLLLLITYRISSIFYRSGVLWPAAGARVFSFSMFCSNLHKSLLPLITLSDLPYFSSLYAKLSPSFCSFFFF